MATSDTAAAVAAAPLFSPAWAQACRDAVDRGPSPAARSKKIDRYWTWIDEVRPKITAVWGLAARDLDGPNCLLLTIEAGALTGAEVVGLDEGRVRATYLQVGDLEAWRQLVDGYDVGKAVMYRRLMLEEGDVLLFFRTAYFWTESLAAIQEIPASVPA